LQLDHGTLCLHNADIFPDITFYRNSSRITGTNGEDSPAKTVQP